MVKILRSDGSVVTIVEENSKTESKKTNEKQAKKTTKQIEGNKKSRDKFRLKPKPRSNPIDVSDEDCKSVESGEEKYEPTEDEIFSEQFDHIVIPKRVPPKAPVEEISSDIEIISESNGSTKAKSRNGMMWNSQLGAFLSKNSALAGTRGALLQMARKHMAQFKDLAMRHFTYKDDDELNKKIDNSMKDAIYRLRKKIKKTVQSARYTSEYKCAMCTWWQGSNLRTDMDAHMLNFHSKTYDYFQCFTCKEKFRDTKTLDAHVKGCKSAGKNSDGKLVTTPQKKRDKMQNSQIITKLSQNQVKSTDKGKRFREKIFTQLWGIKTRCEDRGCKYPVQVRTRQKRTEAQLQEAKDYAELRRLEKQKHQLSVTAKLLILQIGSYKPENEFLKDLLNILCRKEKMSYTSWIKLPEYSYVYWLKERIGLSQQARDILHDIFDESSSESESESEDGTSSEAKTDEGGTSAKVNEDEVKKQGSTFSMIDLTDEIKIDEKKVEQESVSDPLNFCDLPELEPDQSTSSSLKQDSPALGSDQSFLSLEKDNSEVNLAKKEKEDEKPQPSNLCFEKSSQLLPSPRIRTGPIFTLDSDESLLAVQRDKSEVSLAKKEKEDEKAEQGRQSFHKIQEGSSASSKTEIQSGDIVWNAPVPSILDEPQIPKPGLIRDLCGHCGGVNSSPLLHPSRTTAGLQLCFTCFSQECVDGKLPQKKHGNDKKRRPELSEAPSPRKKPKLSKPSVPHKDRSDAAVDNSKTKNKENAETESKASSESKAEFSSKSLGKREDYVYVRKRTDTRNGRFSSFYHAKFALNGFGKRNMKTLRDATADGMKQRLVEDFSFQPQNIIFVEKQSEQRAKELYKKLSMNSKKQETYIQNGKSKHDPSETSKEKNASRYVGVAWNKSNLCWIATAYIGGKRTEIARSEDEHKTAELARQKIEILRMQGVYVSRPIGYRKSDVDDWALDLSRRNNPLELSRNNTESARVSKRTLTETNPVSDRENPAKRTKKSQFKNVRRIKSGGWRGEKTSNGLRVTVTASDATTCARRLNYRCYEQNMIEPNPEVGREQPPSNKRREAPGVNFRPNFSAFQGLQTEMSPAITFPPRRKSIPPKPKVPLAPLIMKLIKQFNGMVPKEVLIEKLPDYDGNEIATTLQTLLDLEMILKCNIFAREYFVLSQDDVEKGLPAWRSVIQLDGRTQNALRRAADSSR